MKKNLIIIIFFLFGCDQNNSNNNKILLGKKIYTKHCSSCHDSGLIESLTSNAPDLSKIIYSVTYGGRGMPSYKDILSDEEINSVALYIKKIGRNSLSETK